MRIIGHLNGEAAARTFVDYLYVKGIECEPEKESGEQWAIWVCAEDQLDDARDHLSAFLANPSDPRFAIEGKEAASMRESNLREEAAYQKRMKESAEMVDALHHTKTGRLTLGLIITCIAIFVLMNVFDKMRGLMLFWLKISNFTPEDGGIGLPEIIFQGEVWRLVTPILMHGGFVHILFNLWWLKDLGGILEWRLGWKPLSILILIIAIASNLAQYYASGPHFLGISGVVFGLLGFIWMKGKHDPNFGIQLPPVIVGMMLLWLILGYTGILDRLVGGSIANAAHSAGLIAGMLCAFAPYWNSKNSKH